MFTVCIFILLHIYVAQKVYLLENDLSETNSFAIKS